MAKNPQYQLIDGDIFDLTFRKPNVCICQQCNCVALKTHGLSKDIANMFGLYANSYARRKGKYTNIADPQSRGVPGSLEFCKGTPCVANLFSQYMYGKPGQYNVSVKDDDLMKGITLDTYDTREEYMCTCLDNLLEILANNHADIDTVVFPYKIGCELAGGNWTRYVEMINNFADKFMKLKNTNHVIIVKKDYDRAKKPRITDESDSCDFSYADTTDSCPNGDD
nr:MAG: wsv206-like protein [Marsupenaeus japonicus endogenous nimavirus]